MTDYIRSYADISPCGKYRYLLEREWRGTHAHKNWRWMGVKDGAGTEMGEPKSVLFVMLNPSTADGEVDDPTIRRCVGFAKAWNYERLAVVNLYAYRATQPEDLFKAGEAMHGPRNQEVIEEAVRDAGIIICAWGANATDWPEVGRSRCLSVFSASERLAGRCRPTRSASRGQGLTAIHILLVVTAMPKSVRRNSALHGTTP